MGYPSDVVIVLNKAGIEELDKKIAELPDGDDKECVMNCLDLMVNRYRSGDFELFQWRSINWYPNYDGHRGASLLDGLIYNMPYGNYRFIRIGYEYDDIEVRGALYDNPFDVHVERTIRFNV